MEARAALFVLVLTILVMALAAAGCGQHVSAMDPQYVSKRIGFLRDSETTQLEIFNRLGEPGSRYETGRIVIYKMHEEPNGALSVGGGEREFNLILVFRQDGVLERHSLLRVR